MELSQMHRTWAILRLIGKDFRKRHRLKILTTSEVTGWFGTWRAIWCNQGKIDKTRTSVGLLPRARMTVPSTLVVMHPSPSLSNSWKASLYSASLTKGSFAAILDFTSDPRINVARDDGFCALPYVSAGYGHWHACRSTCFRDI